MRRPMAVRKVSCHRPTVSHTAAASAVVWGRMAASGEKRLTPRGTQATVASVGYRSSTPARVSSSTSPSLRPGHTTTWPWTSMPPSRRACSQRRLVAPRRLRSRSARMSGSVAWMETNRGLRRSVSTRSRSISVKRVRVVKLP